MYKVLIAGCGQLGLRYLQSAALCGLPLEVHMLDRSQEALKKAKTIREEMSLNAKVNKIYYHDHVSSIQGEFDLVIVSTTATSRALLIGELCKSLKTKYWVIEKIVEQSKEQLNCIEGYISDSQGAWVNLYMRTQVLYKKVKRFLEADPNTNMKVSGNFSLSSSSIHFIDLFKYFTNQEPIKIDTSLLDKSWHCSKREGYWDVYGTLCVNFDLGGLLEITSRKSKENFTIKIIQDGQIWTIDELSGLAFSSGGQEIKYDVLFQSQRKLIEEILDTGACDLPTFSEINRMHGIYIDTFLAHWNSFSKRYDVLLPIT